MDIVEGTPSAPFGRSYWVVAGQLLAGYYPGSWTEERTEKKLGALLDAGIRCVVNLVEEEEVNRDQQTMQPYQNILTRLSAKRGIDITYLRISITDMRVPSEQTMQMILDAIDGAIGRTQPVYVHCWGGYGRTGTVIGCYLARHDIARGDAVMDYIAELRRNEKTGSVLSPQNEEQRTMVRQWQKGI